MPNGKKISKKDAIEMVKKFKAKHSKSTQSVLYDANLVQEMLNVPGCVSLRIHLAENATDITTFVLVAVDKDGNAILPTEGVTGAQPAFIINDGLPCPPACPSGEL